MKVQDPDTFAAAPVAEAGGVESTTDSAFAADFFSTAGYRRHWCFAIVGLVGGFLGCTQLELDAWYKYIAGAFYVMSLACAWIFILIGTVLTRWVTHRGFFRPLSRTPPGSVNHSDIIQDAWQHASFFLVFTWIDLFIAASLHWPEVMQLPSCLIAVFVISLVLAFFCADDGTSIGRH